MGAAAVLPGIAVLDAAAVDAGADAAAAATAAAESCLRAVACSTVDASKITTLPAWSFVGKPQQHLVIMCEQRDTWHTR
jgi:hypothetical protein